MCRRKYPMRLFAIQAGRLLEIGSTTVEVIEWTHHDGSRTVLAPYPAIC